eukprot:1375610-Amphidinium_carterae.1
MREVILGMKVVDDVELQENVVELVVVVVILLVVDEVLVLVVVVVEGVVLVDSDELVEELVGGNVISGVNWDLVVLEVEVKMANHCRTRVEGNVVGMRCCDEEDLINSGNLTAVRQLRDDECRVGERW